MNHLPDGSQPAGVVGGSQTYHLMAKDVVSAKATNLPEAGREAEGTLKHCWEAC